jgi:DNA-binding transcriptional MerR regulator
MRVDQAAGQLTVGQLASRTGVRAGMVPYYEREGLLPIPQRTGGEQRRYGPTDLDRLLFIRGAQRFGLRLAGIRELLAVRDGEGAELSVGAAGGGLPRVCPVMAGTLVAAGPGQVGRFLRSEVLGVVSRAGRRVDRRALPGALGGSPGGAGRYG